MILGSTQFLDLLSKILNLLAMQNPVQRRASNVHGTDDIRRHYVTSLIRHDTRTFVDNLALANNEMMERLKQIGKLDSDVVHLVELHSNLRLTSHSVVRT